MWPSLSTQIIAEENSLTTNIPACNWGQVYMIPDFHLKLKKFAISDLHHQWQREAYRYNCNNVNYYIWSKYAQFLPS